MTDNTKTCMSCKHYMVMTKFCRRSPPTPFVVGMDPNGNPMVQALFPMMESNGYCGEHALQLAGLN